jgi:cell filamentation protein
MTDPTGRAAQDPAWRSYLMPGSDVVRTVPELISPVAVALFERMVSGDAEVRLRQVADRPRTLDLAHLQDLHRRLFEQVYPFAGQLRYVDVAKPGQTGEPFLHHRWIETYLTAVAEQLRAQENLTGLRDPGEWADRAGYFWAALHHAHPFREGNGRTIRLWVEDLAAAAGHRLDWRGVSPERQVNVVAAAAHGDYEPTRALLTVAVNGRVGVDRPVAALDDLHRLQHRQAWAAVGLTFGSDSDRDAITHDLRDVGALLDAVRQHLDTRTGRAVSTEQPAAERWRGLAASVHPGLPASRDWQRFAADLDQAADAGVDIAVELPRLAVRDMPPVTASASGPGPRPAAGSASGAWHDPGQEAARAAAAGYQPLHRPPAAGPRR